MSGSSREGSPDWLRSYEAPITSASVLSSPSNSSPDDSAYRESEIISSLPEPDDCEAAAIMDNDSPESSSRKNSKTKSVTKKLSRKKKADASLNLEGKQNGDKVDIENISSKHKDAQGGDDTVCLLSSESEKDEDFVPKAKEKKSAVKKAPKEKSPKKKPETPNSEISTQEILKSEDKDTDAIIIEEGTTETKTKPSAGSSSRLPLVLSEKVNRTKGGDDSEKDEDFVPKVKEKKTAVKKVPKEKPPKTKPDSGLQTPEIEISSQEILKSEDIDTTEEGTTDKNIKACAGSSSRLPLVLSEKVNRTKVLVECEGDSIDLSGDMGAVGRVVISDTTEDVYLDLKGTIYKSTIVPSRTFCVVNVGQSEAKIEAIMNDFIQLTPQSNVFESETMMEGTLEGYTFDSDNEGDKNTNTASKPADQSEDATEVTDTKAKAKTKTKAKGESVLGKKRARPSKDKPPPAKKARNSAPKKTKAKK